MRYLSIQSINYNSLIFHPYIFHRQAFCAMNGDVSQFRGGAAGVMPG